MSFARRALARAAGLVRDAAELILVACTTEGAGHDPAPITDEVDDTETWPIVAQDPITPAARAMQWRGRAPREPTPQPQPLAGSVAARMRAPDGSR